MLARFKARMAHDVQAMVTDALALSDLGKVASSWLRLERQIQFLVDRRCEAMSTLLRLAPKETALVRELQHQVAQVGAAEVASARGLFEGHLQKLGGTGLEPQVSEPNEWDRQAATLVPERKFPGPVSTGGHMFKLSTEQREKWRAWLKQHRAEYGATTTQADYWVDGRRTVADIVDLVECETGVRCAEVLVEHFRLLQQLGLMGLRQLKPETA